MSDIEFELSRNAFGRLICHCLATDKVDHVIPVRAFPLLYPTDGISLMNEIGQEVAWIEKLTDLPDEMQKLVAEELAQRELMPVIKKVLSISNYNTPSLFRVVTNKGETRFMLQDDSDIRRVNTQMILFTDPLGVSFLIPNVFELDSRSRQMIEHFI